MLDQEQIKFPEKHTVIQEQSYRSVIQIHRLSFKTIEESERAAQHISEFCPSPLKAEIGLNEMFMNAIEHGNLSIGHEEKTALLSQNIWLSTVYERLLCAENKNKKVTVIVEKTLDTITIKIKDCGQGFNWKPYLCPSYTQKCNGRGITIAKQYAFDDIRYNSIGNEVMCYIYL